MSDNQSSLINTGSFYLLIASLYKIMRKKINDISYDEISGDFNSFVKNLHEILKFQMENPA